jgi:mRNA interferase MazF
MCARVRRRSGANRILQRGQVYRCDLGYGLKPRLVVSNNSRNRLLSDVIAIRLTTTARELPTWVELSPADPLAGYANADCIEQLGKDELNEYLGALSAGTMQSINRALMIALALPQEGRRVPVGGQ